MQSLCSADGHPGKVLECVATQFRKLSRRSLWLFSLERGPSGKVAIEMERVLWPAYESIKVDMDEPKTPAIAERPFEIIEKRPYEITAHRHAGFDGVEYCPEIVAQISNALAVVNSLVGLDPVGK